ncbi:hypothetical protein BUE80_DR001746, partial [Diplocarpon rosae]
CANNVDNMIDYCSSQCKYIPISQSLCCDAPNNKAALYCTPA